MAIFRSRKHTLVLTLISVILVQGVWASSRAVDSYIYSPRVTSWGQWGDWEFCPTGYYVAGVQLRIEPYQGSGVHGDDTGLNSIHLMCRSINQERSQWISSKEGSWGEGTSVAFCPDVATGFELRSEPANSDGGDNVAASDFALYCTGPTGGDYKGAANTLDWGHWSGLQQCPSGEAICGMQTQVESYLGDGDDTALNNVDLACCTIERPTTN